MRYAMVSPCRVVVPGHVDERVAQSVQLETSGHVAEDIWPCCPGHLVMLPSLSPGHVAQYIWPRCPGQAMLLRPSGQAAGASGHVAQDM